MRHSSIKNDSQALLNLVGVSKTILEKRQTHAYERTMRYFAISLVNSSASVAILCDAGFGIDAVKIARGIFETYVTFKYLLVRPEELKDFLDFDAITRYKRLQLWKDKMPAQYAAFSTAKIESVTASYQSNRKRFVRKDKVRSRWCKHDLAEMARVAGLQFLYDIFYRHASLLHHNDPMGLAVSIDGRTLEIQPGPTDRYVAIPSCVANLALRDVLAAYSKLIGVDCSDALKQIDDLLARGIDIQGSFLGSLTEAFPANEG
jgi:hypothetical protein